MERSLATVALACAVLGAGAASASATTLHVAPYRLLKGSTTLPCAAAKPCNLAFALASAGAGDDVAMEPGDYRQPVVSLLQTPGPYTSTLEVPKEVALHGDPGAAPPVIHARMTANAQPAVHLSAGAALRDVTIEAQPDAGVPVSYAVLIEDTATAERIRAVVTGTAGTLATACATDGGTVRDSLCLGTGAAGRVDGVVGSVVGDQAYQVRNVTAITTTPTGYGLRLGTSSYAATMTATNVIARGPTADIGIGVGVAGGDATLSIDHSNWSTQQATIHLGATGRFVLGAGNQTGATAATPLFVAPAALDYRQAAGSPTIDAGADDPANGALALGGAPRTVGAATDIGADEFVPPPVTGVAGGGPGGGGTPGGGGATTGADTTAPRLSGLTLGRTFSSRGRTTIRFRLSEPARVTLLLAKRLQGRRVGHACRPRTRVNAARRHCVRLVVVGRLGVAGVAGLNRVVLTGRLPSGRRLTPGAYVLVARAVDPAGNAGPRRTARFTVRR